MRLAWLAVTACSSPPPAIHTTFASTSEGWALQAFDTDHANYTVDPQLASTVTWDPSGDGSVMRNDLVGVTDYFEAAAPFLDDLSAYAGGSLTYTIREGSTDTPFDAPSVLLDGDGMRWKYDASPSASTQPFEVTVPLGGDGWSRIDGGTNRDLAKALAHVTSLWLRGEFSSALESSWLDDVTIAP